MSTLLAFLHHVAAFTLAASLAVEFMLLRMEFTAETARSLRLADAVFGISAAAVLAVGVLRVAYFEKGLDYYLSSPAFLAKISLFVIVGLLSIAPTRTFLSWGRTLKASGVPTLSAAHQARLRLIVSLELAGIAMILLCAAAMARGVWI